MSFTAASSAVIGSIRAVRDGIIRRPSTDVPCGDPPPSAADAIIDAKAVGICAAEVYFPRCYVSQSELEEHSGVSAGKYTIGLGQDELALVNGDAEDVNSMALTVVRHLLEKYEIAPSEIGYLAVGTETLVDKSKSTKTVLMELFPGNPDLPGATVLNACYGGTSALLSALDHVGSDGWDGRLALVVAADVAAYARGPARPTCGAGACALLVGRGAPLAADPRDRCSHAANAWDFFKPDHSVEYPIVDGAMSQGCYYDALEGCWDGLAEKIRRRTGGGHFGVEDLDYFCFHAPYNKLVQKSFGRMFLCDARRKASNSEDNKDTEEEGKRETTDDPLAPYLDLPSPSTYSDRSLEKTLKTLSAKAYKEKLEEANLLSKKIGNTYAASVFMGIASLIDSAGGREALEVGKTIGVFSYGSGSIATMYRLKVRQTTQQRFTIAGMAARLSLPARLAARERVAPGELDLALGCRARMHRAGAPYSPVYPPARMFPGTYYLCGIGGGWVRTYGRAEGDAGEAAGAPLAPPIVLRLSKREERSTPVTGMLRVMASEGDLRTNSRRRVACVITGVAAGLPGKGGKVFRPDNLQRLIEGEQCIEPISGSLRASLMDKNVVQLVKGADGSRVRKPIGKEVIRLAAQLGDLDLSSDYGIPKGLAETMDLAAQVAVAAGLEALKNAGLVSGRTADPAEWILPEQHRDTTGVVYASSFPAMDAAVGEVMRFLQSKTVGAAGMERLVCGLRSRLVRASPDRKLNHDDEAALARLLARANEAEGADDAVGRSAYEFDRKFLFRVLVLGNAQLAQVAGCRGPNTQTNAACAGTTQAIAMAQDMLISGRARRVVVVAGDNASGEALLPWLGSGFRALGAATTEGAVEDAAMPFDKRRSGMLLGAGGIGMVLETEDSAQLRITESPENVSIKARLLATQYSNSAFHGAALCRKHIASELRRFLHDVELVHGISKAEIASHGVYLSHETSTHASPAASCSGNEIGALREAFGDALLQKLLVVNTKGFTGHPMGVSFEDVAAVEILSRQRVPPISNYREKDDYLGDLKLSKGGAYACRYALRFAAGFGSQVVFALYTTTKE